MKTPEWKTTKEEEDILHLCLRTLTAEQLASSRAKAVEIAVRTLRQDNLADELLVSTLVEIIVRCFRGTRLERARRIAKAKRQGRKPAKSDGTAKTFASAVKKRKEEKR